MKKLAIALVAVLLMSGLALAGDTEGTDWNNADWMNSINEAKHKHGYNESEAPAGIGYDLTLHEDKGVLGQTGVLESSEIQSKWDVNNDEVSVFLVGQGNLSKIINTVMSWFQ